MCSRVTSSHSYDEALRIIMEYIEPCSDSEMYEEETEDFEMEMG